MFFIYFYLVPPPSLSSRCGPACNHRPPRCIFLYIVELPVVLRLNTFSPSTEMNEILNFIAAERKARAETRNHNHRVTSQDISAAQN